MSFEVALGIALTKYVFKFFIAIVDTIFIYFVRNFDPKDLKAVNG